MAESSIVIWGSGAIGRGFIADLFQAGGYEIVLVDQAQSLVEQLRRARQYTVVRAKSEAEREEITIKNYRVYSTGEAAALQTEVNQCRLIAIAVYPPAFDTVA